jgi:hypothetical protein
MHKGPLPQPALKGIISIIGKNGQFAGHGFFSTAGGNYKAGDNRFAISAIFFITLMKMNIPILRLLVTAIAFTSLLNNQIHEYP